eukprot:TRINITY_DN11984_c0_g1_i2.p1 TRINITY_DN11984_c0_g1~~TRINITY_DN11984_c0_g1_i2.p1  ORF type:complete len:272 (+),score=76.13 TRINITY_DN11984_c0_g1_i2:79-894(+)
MSKSDSPEPNPIADFESDPAFWQKTTTFVWPKTSDPDQLEPRLLGVASTIASGSLTAEEVSQIMSSATEIAGAQPDEDDDGIPRTVPELQTLLHGALKEVVAEREKRKDDKRKFQAQLETMSKLLRREQDRTKDLRKKLKTRSKLKTQHGEEPVQDGNRLLLDAGQESKLPRASHDSAISHLEQNDFMPNETMDTSERFAAVEAQMNLQAAQIADIESQLQNLRPSPSTTAPTSPSSLRRVVTATTSTTSTLPLRRRVFSPPSKPSNHADK